MTSPPRLPARRVAHAMLVERARVQGVGEGSRLAQLSRQERRAAFQLVQGVRRRQILLDAVLRSLLSRPHQSLPGPVRAALRLGLYELLFRENIAPAGVVSAAVELAHKQPWRGLTNAVLRRAAASIEEVLQTSEAPRDRRHLWIAPGRWVRLSCDVLPDPSTDLVGWHSILYGLPRLFVTELMRDLPDEFEQLFRALDTKRSLTLRPTWRVGGMDQLLQRLDQDGVDHGALLPPVVELAAGTSPQDLAVLREGLAVIQDRTAAEVAPFVDPQPGELIMELCAAPGGKTVQMAELMRDQGQVLALDISAARLQMLRENASRLGLQCIETRVVSKDGSDIPHGPFERVLVDVPCSNSGVLMRKVEARSRLVERAIASLATLQAALLERAGSCVAPGGRLIYSTCSLLAAENQEVVRGFLEAHPRFSLQAEELRYPHRTLRDGGYRALLRSS